MLTIARTLMGNPELLLLDEPSEGLAPLVVEHLKEQIARLKRDGLTILLAEQNVEFCLDLADRVYVLEKGHIRYDGTARDVPRRRVDPPPVPRALTVARAFLIGCGAMATFTVTCPCCSGRLTIDPELEAVVAHEPPPAGPVGPRARRGAVLAPGRGGQREERFKEQIKAEQKKSQVLEREVRGGAQEGQGSPDPTR